MKRYCTVTGETEFYIYGLVCPIKKEIIYVGATCDLEARLSHHRNGSSSIALTDYIEELRKRDMQADLRFVILEGGHTMRSQVEAEKQWIVALSGTHDLLNVRHKPRMEVNVDGLSIAEYEKLSGKNISKLQAA